MSDSIFLLGDDGVLIEVAGVPYDAEAELQELLAGHVDSKRLVSLVWTPKKPSPTNARISRSAS